MIQSSGNRSAGLAPRIIGRWVWASSIAMFHCASALAEPSVSELAVARRLFAEAEALERDGRWTEALAKLDDAIAIKDTPGLRFHAAHVEEKLGRLVEAATDYDRAEELIARGMSAPDVQQLLEKARANLERRLPLLVVLVPPHVQGLSVELDGHPLATSVVGRPTPVDIGPHNVRARAPGYRPFTANVTLEQGQHLSLKVKLELEPVPVVPRKPAPVQHVVPRPLPVSVRANSYARTYVLITESVVSLAALSVGGGFLLTLPSTYDRVRYETSLLSDSDCRAGAPPLPEGAPGSCERLDRALYDYHRAQWIGYGGLAAGGISVLATTLTYFIWSSSPATVQASIAGNGAWLGLSGQF